MYTSSEENYLKAVFNISGKDNRKVSTNDVADALQTKASSATDMLQKLADKKLLKYEKYKGAALTTKGRSVAAGVIRKHRLWEVFLVEKLNFKWDEIHEIAEQLEHIHSERLIDRLEDYLGFPSHDPHGDPIPDKDGKIEHHTGMCLCDLDIGESAVIAGVKEHSADFLQYLEGVKLMPGTKVKVLKRYEYDKSLIIDTGKSELPVSERVSKNLYLKRLNS